MIKYLNYKFNKKLHQTNSQIKWKERTDCEVWEDRIHGNEQKGWPMMWVTHWGCKN